MASITNHHQVSIQGLYLTVTATVGEDFFPSSKRLLVWQDSENKLVMESHGLRMTLLTVTERRWGDSTPEEQRGGQGKRWQPLKPHPTRLGLQQ